MQRMADLGKKFIDLERQKRNGADGREVKWIGG